jgi:hypothetical protein
LGISFLVLLMATFRGDDAPRVDRLALFLLLLGVAGALGYAFLIKVVKYNPNPRRVEIARFLTKDNMIYLGDFVPGLYDLDYITRIDTDNKDEDIEEEWLAFYQYDVHGKPEVEKVPERYQGPFGAAIYDYRDCRPPAILSFELVPVSYDYLGENEVNAVVENIISYPDPLSAGRDYPEVIVAGKTRGVVTDLNIFRKVGVELDCRQWREWRQTHPGEVFPNPTRYENIGSFRGSYQVKRAKSSVTVIDRAGFERSQFVVRRLYTPNSQTGSYFDLPDQVLLDPIEYTLDFGPGQPDEVSQVYYPEKAVLAFYRALGKDEESLNRAKSYLSEDAKARYDINTHQFGLDMSREKVARVLVLEIRYHPDVQKEQAHEERTVAVQVVGVDKDGNWRDNNNPPRLVTWRIIGVNKAGAIPYGCEWKLDEIVSVASP